jgi:hypothetical protein
VRRDDRDAPGASAAPRPRAAGSDARRGGLFLLYDRKVWRTNFGAEPYRLIDVGVALALVAGGFAIAWAFAKEPDRRPRALGGVAVVGAVGAFGFVALERIIVAIV